MGAGYTRWFRPGGWIGFLHDKEGYTNVPLTDICIECTVFAESVWPSKKSFFGLYDPQPVNYFAQAIVDRHTVHKLGEDIYFFTPGVTYIDEATKIKEEQWEELKNSDLLGNLSRLADFYRKETKVPNVSKRQRFLDAGGSFSQPTIRTTVEGSVWVKKCHVTDSDKCRQEPKYIVPYSGHYHPDFERMSVPSYVKNRTHNFENILQNTDENIWHAARDRKFYIKQGQGFGYIGKDTMADKHLISTMRYLVAAWKEIQQQIFKANKSFPNYGMFKQLILKSGQAKNAPSFYEIILPCWPTLVSEFVERFGSEALTSVLDGN